MDETEQQYVQYEAVQQEAVHANIPEQAVIQEQLIQDTVMETIQETAQETVIQEATTMSMAQSLLEKLDLMSAGEKLMNGNALAVGMFSLTVAILSFFVYKLVSSINNRQKSKDAKKKQKQKGGSESPKSAAAAKKKV
jgi:predicted house-cleaning noncanonical NTP pyrophosphatase (MazG superfamily)